MKFLSPEIAPVPELIILLCSAVFLPSVLPLPAPRSGFPTSLAFCGSSSLHIVRPPPHCRVPAPLRLLPSTYISFTCGAEIPLWPPAPQASSKSSLGSFLAAPQSLWISFQGFGLHLFRPQPMFDPHSHLMPYALLTVCLPVDLHSLPWIHYLSSSWLPGRCNLLSEKTPVLLDMSPPSCPSSGIDLHLWFSCGSEHPLSAYTVPWVPGTASLGRLRLPFLSVSLAVVDPFPFLIATFFTTSLDSTSVLSTE